MNAHLKKSVSIIRILYLPLLCMVVLSFASSFVFANSEIPESACGDGIVQQPEQCDFGSILFNTGLSLSSNAQFLMPYQRPSYSNTVQVYTCTNCYSGTHLISGGFCGDGQRQELYEQCDSSAQNEAYNCDSTCKITGRGCDLNSMECKVDGLWNTCSQIAYGSALEEVKVKSSDGSQKTIRGTYTDGDGETFFEGFSYSVEQDAWVSRPNIVVDRSGQNELTLTCIMSSCIGPDYAQIPNEQSLEYFQSDVPLDGQCVSEQRTCIDGALSGSYQYSYCIDGWRRLQ
jgi:hypothetical protein